MKVAIGLSGGVDSSVAACILKEQGHEVVGVTMLIWPDSKCCSGEAVEDAKKVAAYLGIEHQIYDLVPEFTKEIVENFVSEYANGRTPNPCPTCNSKMKFNYLWNAVQKMHPDVEKIATGHYVHIEYSEDTKRYQIFKGLDKTKDQSYMLYKLNQEQLSKIMLPLGKEHKKHVRVLAREMGLIKVSSKADSMDLCFTSGSLKDFLKKMAPEKVIAGDVIDTDGHRLGSHDGIMNYTIGQRKGINVDSIDRLFVVGINASTNTIIVGKEDKVYSPGLIATDVSWLSIPTPTTPILADVKNRYLETPEPAEIIPIGDGNYKIVFKNKQRAITPGQVTVFYSGEMLLGGGVIYQVIE
ncbi:MAG: tRNA 2-thiouridine(34) synthase MnmA [Candidatus Sericytochromatia bacterium]|nr:tRNA 2-thiouridine(34) synthase MnmA [Candidatus Sericytochromatia bacterium]